MYQHIFPFYCKA